MEKEQIKSFVKTHPELVSMKSTSMDGVYVLKYKNKVFYKNLWTPELLDCRGTVVDEDFNIISRPFTKIFNYGENKTHLKDDEPCIGVRKVNGFMAAVTIHNDNLLVSTTGSIDSEFAKMAKKWLTPYADYMTRENTCLFEIVDQSDPHIIKEEYGAYLIGCRSNIWDSNRCPEPILDEMASRIGCRRPSWKTYDTFKDLKEEVKYVNHEGFMVYSLDRDYSLKIKSPYYLTTKFLGRMNDAKLLKMIEDPENLKKCIDEEFYDIVDHISDNTDLFLSMDNQHRIEYVRNFFDKKFMY